MSGKEYFDQIRKIKNGDFAPTYLLLGDDVYLNDYFISEIYQALSKISPIERIACYGDAQNVEQTLASHLGAGSLFSEKKLIILRTVNQFSAQSKDLIADKFSHPNPDHVIVLQTKSIDKRKTFWKKIAKAAVSAETKTFYEQDINRWLSKFVQAEFNATISNGAIHHLATTAGNSLADIASEIEKIMIHFDEPAQITEKHVKSISYDQKDASVFDLEYNIGNRNKIKTVNILRKLFGQGVEAGQILWQIQELFIRLFVLHGLSEKSPANVQKKCRLRSPGIARNYIRYAQNYRSTEIQNAIGILVSTDKTIKTSSVDSKTLLSHSIVSILKK